MVLTELSEHCSIHWLEIGSFVCLGVLALHWVCLFLVLISTIQLNGVLFGSTQQSFLFVLTQKLNGWSNSSPLTLAKYNTELSDCYDNVYSGLRMFRMLTKHLKTLLKTPSPCLHFLATLSKSCIYQSIKHLTVATSHHMELGFRKW